ncbi:thiosulfate oxidation carrier complex protein SoxZ [Methylobacterium sp. NEAU 140]|uniref:thiosulfate oxidation carrier complex protein SoxZ n=1 Tax=Methylobacterium sp. NEAU 140 TaxID=3064945 RepID=UPI002733DA84|nr:thiosulfate oxidation carrier complex protein SoxZ [Methylobacterium sp. NEAU 140]MDP4024678.1 thiosulfate oxidation carrier complex protein SoxZ [Methylobacterium sp. NEAU 140]
MADVKPRIKLDKKEVAQGGVIEVKTLVSHTMESGQRKDKDGKTIPRKILNTFTCDLNGKTLFSANLESAVSANPYFQFKIRPEESGTLTFTWTDDDGSKIQATEQIKVA